MPLFFSGVPLARFEARRGPKDHQHCSCEDPLEKNQHLVKLKTKRYHGVRDISEQKKKNCVE